MKSYGEKYVKQSYHKKKILSDDEIRKREWRKEIKYKDSRSKKNYFNWSKYIRDYNYRSLRRWTKARLDKSDYDLERGWKRYNHFNTEYFW